MPLLVKRKSLAEFAKHNQNQQSPDSSQPSSTSNISPFHPQDRRQLTWLAAPVSHPVRPSSEHGHTSASHSRLSHELYPDDISESTTDSETRLSRKRFSLMKFRNFSESQLSARVRMDEEKMQEELPPVPTVTAEGVLPKIVKTAPTMDHAVTEEISDPAQERNVRPSLFKRSTSRRTPPRQSNDGRKSTDERRAEKRASTLRWRRGKTGGLEDLHRLSTLNMSNNNNHSSAPPSYGDETHSALVVPLAQLADPRVSESSRSDESDGHIYASTTTTTHTVSTHTTFFRLPRRNKNRNSLFPLPVKISPPDAAQDDDDDDQQGPATPRASSQSNTPETQGTPTSDQQTPPGLQRRHTTTSPIKQRPHSHSVPAPHAALAKSSLSFAEPGLNLFRHSSQRSLNSATSSPLQPPMRLGFRDRSSTTSSFGRSSQDVSTPPALSVSGRNSTSTTGRSSFGGFLNLSRFRQGSEPHSPRHGSPGSRSKSNSFALSREVLVIPEREEGDTPGKYLERLESAVSRSVIAGILSKSGDPFAAAVLRSYTRRFPFFGEPVDMSLRKFLLEAELPKETQQVDRVIQAFADRYNECNPGIFLNSDQAYVIAFSIMMLHTDAFNKNNKRKMQKHDYIKNTSGQGLSDDILACFYDNICYTPFVHYDEDVDINGEKVLPFTSKKSTGKLKSAIPGADMTKKGSGPVDPYNLLVEQKLDTLRPAIKDSILLDDPYDYRGSHGHLDAHYLQRAFTHTGILQIISARSRPAAYESQFVNGAPNPTETQQGIVDLKITKVGTLWRKSSKKKKTRSPWQEWGAILTGSQLYLFKNSHWAKGLMHQFTHQQKPNQPRIPVVFKPPLSDFKPDALIKTDNAVALVDATYTRHKHAFTFVRPGGQEEVLLADNENELNDWLGLINYAAAFRAAGVRIRGMLGGTEEDLRSKEVQRLDSTNSVRSIRTTNGEVNVQNRGLSPTLQRQVMAARRQIMVHKISEIEKDITDANKQLENMLRNARHLLVLAPIAPKTRDDVIHAAAKVDAKIKWLRRDVWRLKCHRDTIAVDVQLDGLSASELEKLSQGQADKQAEPDTAKKDKPKILSRLSSSKGNPAKSPPQSPLMAQTAGRPSMTGSLSGIHDNDVFQTPPETATPQREEGWRLPPMNLEQQNTQDQHRPSVTSTLLSATSQHAGSLTHTSSASSVLQVQRTQSYARSDTTDNVDKAPENVNAKELELLARSTMAPAQDESTPRALGTDSQPMSKVSPESSKHKGVRRSLQKTLRDGHYHDGRSHRHRRNKDSDSTVRSAGVDDKDLEDGTPGLQRDKPRFILHGKQASVVQFGGDWERMKMRREQYESQHPVSPTQANVDAAFTAYERRRSEQHELMRAEMRAEMSSQAAQDLAGDQHSSIGEEDDDEDDSSSMLSARSRSFREDAEAAAAYSSMDDPSSSSPRISSSGDDGQRPPSEYFDLTTFDPSGEDRRQTVIGPSPSKARTPKPSDFRHQRLSSLEKGEDGNVKVIDIDVEESEQEHEEAAAAVENSPISTAKVTKEDRRRTVIGPSSLNLDYSASGTGNGKGKAKEASIARETRDFVSAGAAAGSASFSVHEGSASSSRDSVEGEHGFVQPISDEELRKMSSNLSAVAPVLLP